MSLIKRLSLILLIIFMSIFVISFILPSTVKVERKIVISASSELVFKQVNELKNWKNWTVWAEKDSTIYGIPRSYSNPSNGVGATFNWKSTNDEVGEGKLKITKSQPLEVIEATLDFDAGEALSYWNFQEKDDLIEVTWGINIDLGINPLSKWFGLFMKDDLAADVEKGLQKLKTYTENLPQINSGVVTKKFIDKPQWFLSIRDTVDGSEIGTIHSKLFSEISLFMENNKISDDLSPLVIYYSWSDTLVDLEAGILLKDSIQITSNRVKLNKIRVGNVVTATHYGSYDRIPETYFSINEWMRKNEVQVIGAPYEIYIVDPSLEQNPDKWVTEIYFPIK